MTPEIAAIKVSTISIVDPIQDEPLTSTVVSIEVRIYTALTMRENWSDFCVLLND